MEGLKAPTVETADGKTVLKFDLGLDLDQDGQKSLAAGLFVELNHKEAASEAIKKVLENASVPQVIKDLLAKAL